MPSVSVMTSTFRPGGLDVTLAGMRDQTYKDFELVIVDRRYELRHAAVMRLAEVYGIADRVIHVPEHRRNGKWNTICSAWNTAIAVARGEYAIFLQDYAYAPPGWIEAHLSKQAENRLVICPYLYTGMPPLAELKIPGFSFDDQHAKGDYCVELDAVLRGEVFDEMFIFAGGPFDPAWVPELPVDPARFGVDVRLSIRGGETANVEDGWIHLKNEGILRKHLLAINGLDERLERGKGPADIDVALRLRAVGVDLFWAGPTASTPAINARWWCKTMPYGAMDQSVEDRWSFKGEGMRYNAIRAAEVHASADKAKAARAKNKYDIEVLADALEPWRSPSAEPKAFDVSDRDYWGRDVWPDTP